MTRTARPVDMVFFHQIFATRICVDLGEFCYEFANKDAFHGIFIGEGIKLSDVGKIQGRANRVKSSLARSQPTWRCRGRVHRTSIPSLGGKSF